MLLAYTIILLVFFTVNNSALTLQHPRSFPIVNHLPFGELLQCLDMPQGFAVNASKVRQAEELYQINFQDKVCISTPE